MYTWRILEWGLFGGDFGGRFLHDFYEEWLIGILVSIIVIPPIQFLK